MARPRNPLSKRNQNHTFTGSEVARMVAKLGASKRAKVVREATDFDLRALRQFVLPPLIPQASYSWAIPDIVDARNAQMIGQFRSAARLSESMGTDPAIFTARGVRLAPVQSLSVQIDAGRGPKADKIADEADALFGQRGIGISSETITTIRTHLADHGVAFAVIERYPRADGSRVDYSLRSWPIEFVFWHAVHNAYFTQARFYNEEPPDPPHSGLYMPARQTGLQPLVPIVHGDGRWVVFSKSELLPHRWDAAVLPGALVWASHAFAKRDWSKASAAHGNAKVVGELPEGTALSDQFGNLTAEATQFLSLLQAVAAQDSPVGIKPPGSKVDYMVNSSQAWQVWKELAESSEKAAARIYLGTDGILGAQGGAPGVDIQSLFGVATGKVQSDLECIGKAIQDAVIGPWCAENFGNDKQAPIRSYVFPDPEQAQTRDDFSKRNAAFLAAVKAARDAGFNVTPEYVASIASEYGVPVPEMNAAPAPEMNAAPAPSSNLSAPAAPGSQ